MSQPFMFTMVVVRNGIDKEINIDIHGVFLVGYHSALGKRAQSASQACGHGQRSSQCPERLLLLAHWMAAQTKGSWSRDGMQGCTHGNVLSMSSFSFSNLASSWVGVMLIWSCKRTYSPSNLFLESNQIYLGLSRSLRQEINAALRMHHHLLTC